MLSLFLRCCSSCQKFRLKVGRFVYERFLKLTILIPGKVGCYWQAKINASLIVPNICTHVIYSFLGLDDQGGLTYLWRSEAQALRLISSLVGLRLNNSNLNVLASIQGYNDPIWSDVAANPEARLNFSQNILQFVQKTELNGIGKS